MTTTIHDDPRRLDDAALLARLRAIVVRSNETQAETLAYLAEVDERRLYLPEHTSLFAFCTAELGFSEAVAEHSITVARAAKRFPRVLEMRRSGRIHLSGLRVLVPHLTDDNAEALLAQAVGKSKRAIEELVARHAPRPAVADSIRKLPGRRDTVAAPTSAPDVPLLLDAPTAEPERSVAVATPRPATIAPLAPERYHVQLTVSRELRDKIEEAKALLRHQVPSGDLATILDRAVTDLIAKVKKQRFGVGRRPRSGTLPEGSATSRNVPDAVKRAVYERDGGRCTFVGPSGKRCEQRGFVQLDHVEGFARRREHTVDGLRLLCPAHNQHAADVMYGRNWMASKRNKRAQRTQGTRPGVGSELFADGASTRPAGAGRHGGGEETAGPAEVPPDPQPPAGITRRSRPAPAGRVEAPGPVTESQERRT